MSHLCSLFHLSAKVCHLGRQYVATQAVGPLLLCSKSRLNSQSWLQIWYSPSSCRYLAGKPADFRCLFCHFSSKLNKTYLLISISMNFLKCSLYNCHIRGAAANSPQMQKTITMICLFHIHFIQLFFL